MQQIVYAQHFNIILKKIRYLPEDKIIDVVKYIDALLEDQGELDDPVIDVIGSITGKSISSKEIDEQLYGKFIESND